MSVTTEPPESHSVVGVLASDPVGLMLGTGYHRFKAACGIDGLAKVDGKRLDLLAVVTDTPGKGQFREFIRLAKAAYDTVRVWQISNPTLNEALKRYGFTRTWTLGPDGEVVTGRVWTKRP